MRGSSVLSRLWLLYGIIFLVAVVFIAKLFIVQVVHGEEYNSKVDRQYIVSGTGVFDRGTVYFTQKNGDRVSVATLKSGYIVAINPSIINASDVFSKLSKLLQLDSNTFFIKASKKNDPYEEIARRIDKDTIKKIKEFNLKGVIISRENWRFYPGEDMAASLLGFVGYRGNDLVGRYGLERYYNDILSRDKQDLYVNFFTEVFSNIGETVFKGEKREGDIVTSIDLSVQEVLEDELKRVIKKWDSESVGGIIINPKTGEIFGMANFPTFNPNTFNKVKDPSLFSNPNVESVFEMGSIMKPLTMASGIDAGVVNSDTTYDDKGFLIVDGSRIENYDGRGRGVVPMQEVLNQSLNTGAAFVMKKLGKERFRKYMLSLGLGEETGVDLPNEVGGLVDNLNSPRDVEYVTASFGQGVAVTPIAMTRALSSLANKGKLVTPHVVREIDYKLGPSREIVYSGGERVFKESTTEEVARMLVEVVDKALMGGTVKLPHYSIAAKTGTAQIARPDGGGYYKDRYLHSFFGFFPAYNPKFLVFLYTIHPKGVRYASHTLTQPFMNITKFLINYYEIPPDR